MVVALSRKQRNASDVISLPSRCSRQKKRAPGLTHTHRRIRNARIRINPDRSCIISTSSANDQNGVGNPPSCASMSELHRLNDIFRPCSNYGTHENRSRSPNTTRRDIHHQDYLHGGHALQGRVFPQVPESAVYGWRTQRKKGGDVELICTEDKMATDMLLWMVYVRNQNAP